MSRCTVVWPHLFLVISVIRSDHGVEGLAIHMDTERDIVSSCKQMVTLPLATEPSRLLLCNISGFHGGDYEECRLLGRYAVWLLYEPTFHRNLAPTTSIPVLRGVLPKRRFVQEPYGVRPQKTAYFLVKICNV
jgi:hypothetical protein